VVARQSIDIIGDATAQRYRDALTICMRDAQNDGVLVILTPQAMTQPMQVAEAVIDVARQFTKPLLVSWMGGSQVMAAAGCFVGGGISSFARLNPRSSVFLPLRRMRITSNCSCRCPVRCRVRSSRIRKARACLIESVLAEHRKVLNEMESKALLAAFRIPVAQTVVAHSPTEALLLAEHLNSQWR